MKLFPEETDFSLWTGQPNTCLIVIRSDQIGPSLVCRLTILGTGELLLAASAAALLFSPLRL